MDGVGGIGSRRTEVLAHRGYHAGGIAENSLGSFDAALSLGADRIETDVRRTRDGVLVIYHDTELPDGRKLSEVDFAALPSLADGQPIPTLVELAEFARQRNAKLAVELKEAGYERLAMEQLASRVPRENLEVISFNRDSIEAVEDWDPTVRTGLLEPRLPAWLRSSPVYGISRWVMNALDWHPSLSAAAKVGADYVSVEHRMATASFIDAAHERGLPVNAWTVNDPARMRELIRDGVDAIVTDRTDLAVQLRGQGGTAPALPTAPPLPAAS